MSKSELTILIVLSHGERYGREILRDTAELGEGAARLAVGGLYTTLNRMEQRGLITGRWGDDSETLDGARRRYYSLTGEGARALKEAKALIGAAARRPIIGEA